MIQLLVEVATGHYRVPGQVKGEPLGEAPTFPIAPPATIQGFIESLCGANPGEFHGQFAYGRQAPTEGFGVLTRRAQVWSTSGDRDLKKGVVGTDGELVRAIRVPTYIDLSYAVAVRGEWEGRVRSAVRGDVTRTGVLSLGESGDVVTWLAEEVSPKPVQWVVPGRKMSLITKSGRGFRSITATYATFDFGTEPSWFGEPDPDELDSFLEGFAQGAA